MGWKQSGWKVLKAVLLRLLKFFPTLYKYGKLVLRKGLWRVYAVKKGGMYAFLLAVSIMIIGNVEAVMQSFSSLTPAPLFAAWGQDLTSSYFAVKKQLRLVDTATGWGYVNIVVTILIKLSTIAGYFLGARYFLEFVDRDMSPALVYGLPAAFYLAVSWGATGKVPVLHDLRFLSQTVPELFEVEKVWPWADPKPVHGLNKSVNASKNASSVNMTAENLTGNASS